MSDKKESVGRTLGVAVMVCLVCSVVVAGAAVGLKSNQTVNRQLDKQRNILVIAGLAGADASASEVQRIFNEKIKARVVDLATGQYDDSQNANTFDPLKAAREPAQSKALTGSEDIASIKRRENQTVVYLVEGDKGLDTVILPVRGYGLWSTLHGFMALKNDLKTVAGFGFYQHAETAGLGGEVDNPRWRGLWPGKQVFNEEGKFDIAVIKGNVDRSSPRAVHQVDGIAGATLTSNGVNNLLKYWLGPQGFGPYLAKLRDGGN